MICQADYVLFQRRPSCQKATALAAATFSEFTPWTWGSSRCSRRRQWCWGGPSPSVPSTMASWGSERGRVVNAYRIVRQGHRSGPEAQSVQTCHALFRPVGGVVPTCAHGTWNTVPMLTRTARRKGSQQDGVISTASMTKRQPCGRSPPHSCNPRCPQAPPPGAASRIPPLRAGAWWRMAHSTPRVSS